MTRSRKEMAEEVYALGQIKARLRAELPKLTFEDAWICRSNNTSGWKSTLMVVNTVGHLA